MGIFRLALSVALLAVVWGCTGEEKTASPKEPAKAEEAGPVTLRFFNWQEYIGKDTLADFEAETGIKVALTEFEDEEDIIAAVQADPTVDLFVTSDSMLQELVTAKVLAPLDYSLIPNFKHIKPRFRNTPYDPEQKYSVPYLWGTTGIVYNTKHIPGGVDSWAALWDPRLKGKIAMLDNGFEVLMAGAKVAGYGMEPKNDAEFDASAKKLFEQRPLLVGYFSAIDLQRMMIDETIWIAMLYSGEALSAMDENEDLDFVIPGEGSELWVDLLLIPRGANHKRQAHMLIDYIHRPEVMGKIASEMWYATPNAAAEKFMDPEVLESESVYPPPEVLERCEFFAPGVELGWLTRRTAALWNRLTTPE